MHIPMSRLPEVRLEVLRGGLRVRRPGPRVLLRAPGARVQGRRHGLLLQAQPVLLPGDVLPASHPLRSRVGTRYVRAVPERLEKVRKDVLHKGRVVLRREVLLEAGEVLPFGHLLQEGRHVLR